jgi:hypothetical protein
MVDPAVTADALLAKLLLVVELYTVVYWAEADPTFRKNANSATRETRKGRDIFIALREKGKSERENEASNNQTPVENASGHC